MSTQHTSSAGRRRYRLAAVLLTLGGCTGLGDALTGCGGLDAQEPAGLADAGQDAPEDAAADGAGGGSCPALGDPADAASFDELTVAVDFDNANAEVVAIDPGPGELTIEPTSIAQAPTFWWHFRLEGVVPGQALTITTQNDKELGEINPVFSYDRKSWQRLAEDASPFHPTFASSTVWLARNLPYTWARSVALSCELPLASTRVQAIDLTTSEQGRAVKVLRITDPHTADSGKSMLWVQARQHAFESHGSWVAEGLARGLTDADRCVSTSLRQPVIEISEGRQRSGQRLSRRPHRELDRAARPRAPRQAPVAAG